jgi:8-oxo-dGTP pyrophosphatase MutT (NUDIX family)
MSNNKNNTNELFCNNCGKSGHPYHQCKMPITSIGVIAFRIHPETKEPQYLMICRKDTLGYMDFMRGKFPIFQKKYILNMFIQMTVDEKKRLRDKYNQYRTDNSIVSTDISNKSGNNGTKEKIITLINGVHTQTENYNLISLLDESDQIYETWTEPEWGFPKGRRNSQEKDYDCAVREFSEETGYSSTVLHNIRNILPFEEIFIGSNYKSYRHKYYLMYISYTDSISNGKSYQKSEVSNMEWKFFSNAIDTIRSYNLEKKCVLTNVHECIQTTILASIPNDVSYLSSLE